MDNKTGIDLFSAERQRQMDVKNWTPEHDDAHVTGELSAAAATYIQANVMLSQSRNRMNYGVKEIHEFLCQMYWPWSPESLKISTDPLKNLVKAGALLAADADRMLREKR